MKNSVKSLMVAVVLAGLLGAAASAAPMSSVGFIDVQKVFKGYKETSKAQEQLAKEEADFKKDFEASQKKLEEAKKANKSDKEIEDLTKQLESTLAPKRDKLMKMNEALTGKLQNDIVAAVKEAAKGLGIDMVLDKQVVIVGGVDISDMVINKLNKR